MIWVVWAAAFAVLVGVLGLCTWAAEILDAEEKALEEQARQLAEDAKSRAGQSTENYVRVVPMEGE